jgi:hypothetical protein
LFRLSYSQGFLQLFQLQSQLSSQRSRKLLLAIPLFEHLLATAEELSELRKQLCIQLCSQLCSHLLTQL